MIVKQVPGHTPQKWWMMPKKRNVCSSDSGEKPNVKKFLLKVLNRSGGSFNHYIKF